MIIFFDFNQDIKMKDFKIIHEILPKHVPQLMALFKTAWWAKERTEAEVLTMLKTSFSFGLIENNTENLIGYARVLTDEIKYAFIFDVMLTDHLRGKGIGKKLMDAIIAHPKFNNVTRFELTCAPNMVAFYEKFGFSENYGSDVKPMRLSR